MLNFLFLKWWLKRKCFLNKANFSSWKVDISNFNSSLHKNYVIMFRRPLLRWNDNYSLVQVFDIILWLGSGVIFWCPCILSLISDGRTMPLLFRYAREKIYYLQTSHLSSLYVFERKHLWHMEIFRLIKKSELSLNLAPKLFYDWHSSFPCDHEVCNS